MPNQQKETLMPKCKTNLHKLIWVQHKHKTQSDYKQLLEAHVAAITVFHLWYTFWVVLVLCSGLLDNFPYVTVNLQIAARFFWALPQHDATTTRQYCRYSALLVMSGLCCSSSICLVWWPKNLFYGHQTILPLSMF